MKERRPFGSHRTTLDFSLAFLKIIGILDYTPSTLFLRIKSNVIKVFNWAVALCVTTSLAVDVFKNYSDLEALTNDVGYLFPMLGILLKTIAVNLGQKNILGLIEAVHAPILKLRYSSEIGVLTKIRITIFYQSLDFIIFAVVLISTGITIIVMAVLSDTKLPLRGVFPFNETVLPAYAGVFYIQSWMVAMCCLWILLIETSAIELIRWKNVQLVILQRNYENCCNWMEPRANFEMSDDTYERIKNFSYFKLKDEDLKINLFVPFDENEVNVKNDSFILRYKTCLKHHWRIINHVDEYNDFFSVLQFFTVFITCLFVCLCLFQIAVNKQSKAAILNTGILMCSEMCHLGFWCIFGNLLMNEAETIRQSQYNSGWEKELDSEVRHLVINSLIESKEPLKITAGKFFVLSLATYLAVIQKSYSYFAILNTVHSDD
nr:olfactory receptor 113 [Microplitis mediator]